MYMATLSLLFKLREKLRRYPGGLKGFLRAPRSGTEYFVDLRDDQTYTTEPLLWRVLVVEAKDFEEYEAVSVPVWELCLNPVPRRLCSFLRLSRLPLRPARPLRL